MKSRLTLALLGLVVFSTALLTLFAARSLRQDEIIAQRQLHERAEKSVGTAVALIQGRLQNELDQVRNAMADAVAAGGDLRHVQVMAERLEQSRALVARVYLFMNPWGFMWPAESAADAAEVRWRQELLATLRARTATAPEAPFGFRLQDRALVFGVMEGRQGLYVGYEVSPPILHDHLVASLRTAEGGGILLEAEGWGGGFLPGGDERGQVVVRSSLGQRREIENERIDSAAPPRVIQVLPPPLDPIRIAAYGEDADVIPRTMAVRHHLYRWGLAMLALGIVGGASLLLGAARAEIRRARSGSDVALGVSHDLRTPIASMRMLAESLYLGHVPDPARQREFLRTIVEECERLSQLTERVLFLFRFGQDAMQYHRQPADLAQAVQASVDAFLARYVSDEAANGSARSRRPELLLQIDEGVPAVRLDATAFSQVMLNLLDNAVKYGRKSESGGGTSSGTVRIAVRLGREVRRRWPRWSRRTWAVVTVHDDGVGIPRRHQRQIFNRFYRVPDRRDDNVSGVGLGLSVCKHVMEGHGGRISVRSAPDAGTTFALYLPAEEDRA